MLLARRKELKITRQELSILTGLSVVSLTKYENGQTLPKVENLARLANALTLSYNELYNVLLEEKQRRKD